MKREYKANIVTANGAKQLRKWVYHLGVTKGVFPLFESRTFVNLAALDPHAVFGNFFDNPRIL